ncbi:MAG: MATE family efflux transporter [Clostridium sp.]
MDKRENVLGTDPIGKLLLKYSIPAIIAMMVSALYNVVDRIFIGNIPGVGPMAIAGLGVTMPVMSIVMAFGTLIGIGAATNISIKLGEGKKDKAERVLGNALTLIIIVGVTLAVVGLVFLDKILLTFGASEGTLQYAKAYLNIILLGTVFSLMSMAFSNLIRGDGNPKLSATIMAVGCGTNIILDAVFIFVFGMGIQGAALATVIAQAISSLLGLNYYLKRKSTVQLKKASLKLDGVVVKMIFAIGMAPFAMQLTNSLIQVLNNTALKTHGGDLAIGAMATIMSINMIFVMPAFGFVQAMQPIVGYNYGAKKYDRAKKTLIISLVATTVVFTLGGLVIQLAPEMLVGMFNKDPELMKLTVNGIKKYALAMPLIGIPIVGTNYIQSIGKAKMAMVLSLLRQVIVLIPCIMILPQFLQLDGVWFSQPTADTIATVITALVLVKEVKRYADHKKVQTLEIEEEELEEAAV